MIGIKFCLCEVNSLRVKLCFKCKQYIPVHENDYNNKKDILNFDKSHIGHPTQIVNEEEVADLQKWSPS